MLAAAETTSHLQVLRLDKAGFRRACSTLTERIRACKREEREIPADSTHKGKANPTGLVFLPTTACLRGFIRVLADFRARHFCNQPAGYSPFAHSLADLPHLALAEVRKAHLSPLY